MQTMDPDDTDENQWFWNSELFRAVDYGRKRRNITQEKIIEKVKECLGEGADINAINQHNAGNTVLHVAVRHGYKELIKFLLQNGAQMDIKNSQGLTALTLTQSAHCEQEVIDLLEKYVRSITGQLSITYRSKTQTAWNKLRNNSEIAVLEVNSVELSPDFFHQAQFYDAIETAGNLFFVDVMLSDTANINEDFNIQLQQMSKQVIIQCGSVLDTKVYCRGSEGDVNVINLTSPVQYFDEKTLTEKLAIKGFGLGLIVDALKLNLVGKFETERRSLLNVSFDLEKDLSGWKLIDHVIRNGDAITARLLSLNPWNLSKLNYSKTSTLTLAAQQGDVEKLAAVLKVEFPIQLEKDISISKETVVHFDKCKKEMLESAVTAANCDIISFMLRCGVQLDEDIIQLAWDNKQYDVVLLMLKADCVFPYALDIDEDDVTDAQFIKLRNFIDERDHLHNLIKEGQSNSVKKFLKLIAPSKFYLDKENRSAVYKALRFNHFNVFVWLKSEVKAEFKDDTERRSLGVGVLDSATDALLPHFVPIDNAHILHLVSKSRSRHHYEGFKDHIERIYTELNTIPQISTVLKVIQFCDNVDIIYDFEKDSIVDVNVAMPENVTGFCEYKVGRIYIGAKVSKQELLGTVAHELTHLAIQTLYDNDCRPYKLGDSMKEEFDEIVNEIRTQSAPVDSIIRRVFSCYGESGWASELIVRVNHMLAYYGLTDGLSRLEMQAKSLLEFYTNLLEKQFENLVSESHLIKPRYLIKVLNDNSGIIGKIADSKIKLKKCIDVKEMFCESDVQIAVVTSTSPFLSTMSVYHSLQGISQQPNSFMIFNFDGYLKRRIEINQAFYSDICDFLILLCESVPEKSILSASLKGLAQVLWKKSNKKVIFIMENCELSNDDVKELVNLSLKIYPDVEYTMDDVRVESAQLLLDQSVSLQGRDANIKLSSLIDVEHYKLVDAQTLLKLINKQPIVIGKQISTSSHYDERFYIDRSFSHQAVIRDEVLKDENIFTMYALSEIDESSLANIVEKTNLICTFELLQKGQPVKYVIFGKTDGEQQYVQLCQQFPQRNIHWLKKVEGGFLWQESRCVDGEFTRLAEFVVPQLVNHFMEIEWADHIDKCRVITMSDTAGMGKTTTLTSMTHRITTACPHLLVIRVDLNDYTKVIEEEQKNRSFGLEQPSKALDFFVDRLLGSRVESRLETKFEKNLLLHFLQHEKDRVVIMFDGFDEIKNTHQNVILNLLVALKRSKVKQLWVTTRPHMRKTLQNTLHHLSYTLQPLDEADQVNFLTNFWRYRLNSNESDVASGANSNSENNKFQCCAEALINLLSTSISDKEKVFTGVPLQLRMVAEIFEKDAKEFYFSNQTQLNLPSKLPLNELYQKFFHQKLMVFQLEKNKTDLSKQNVEAQNEVVEHFFFKYHQIASLFAIFSDKECKLLLTEDELSSGVSFIRDIDCNKWNTGIIESIVDGKPRFVHLTIAEFLTAECIVNLFSKEQRSIELFKFILTEVLYEDTFRVIRAFVDAHLAEKGMAEAVLNKHGEAMRSLWMESFGGNSDHKMFPGDQHTLLHVTAVEGNANIVNFVLRCLGMCEIRAKLIKCVALNGMQALHIAAQSGHLNVVKVLVEHQADVEARVDIREHYDGFTALLLAAYNAHADICEWLIANGADHNATVSGVQFAGCNILHLAAKVGNLEVLKKLRDIKEVHFEALLKDNGSFDAMNGLHIAAANRQWDVVKWIIGEGLIDINDTVPCVRHNGETVLMWAIIGGSLEVTQWLINNNADVNIGNDIQKNTALHMAAFNNDLEIVKFLVRNAAKVDAVNEIGETPLHVAANFASETVVGFLLTVKDVDVSFSDKHGRKPLHAASERNELETFVHLLSKGANVNDVDHKGHTPLHLAAAKGSDLVLEFILKMKNIDVDVTDMDGFTPLHSAAANDKMKTVKILLQNMANINAVDNNGETPLLMAVAKGCQELVELLMKSEDVDFNFADKIGCTPLHIAALGNKFKILETLLSKGADVNTVNCHGHTPLHHATINDSEFEIERLLAIKGINVNVTDKCGFTPLHLAVFNNKLNIVETLVRNGAKGDVINCDGLTPLHVAAAKGSESMVECLLEIMPVDVNLSKLICVSSLHGATLDNKVKVDNILLRIRAACYKFYNYNQSPVYKIAAAYRALVLVFLSKMKDVDVIVPGRDGITPLHVAAIGNNFNEVKMLLSTRVNVNSVDCYGQTPLHLAAAKGSDLVVEYLLKFKDIDVHCADKIGCTPLHHAAFENKLKAVKILVSKEGYVNAVNSDGDTPLHLAAARGSRLVVEFLLNTKGVDVNAADDIGQTPLHRAAFENILEIVEMLVNKGANVNAVTCYGQTPLHYAAASGSQMVVEFLLKIPAIDINVADKSGATPLHLALLQNNIEVVKMLVDNGANINAVDCIGLRPIHIAAGNGSHPVVDYLLRCKNIDVNVTFEHGSTTLHLAAITNNLRIFGLLVNNGADVNAVDNDGDTPLHEAAANGSELVVDFILKMVDIDINCADNVGNTPLHLAADGNQLEVVEQLLSRGANVNAVDCDGCTPLHKAASKGSDHVVEYLLKFKDTNVNVADKEGHTPLHQAVWENKLKIVEILVCNNVNVNAVNRDGNTPLHLAADSGLDLAVEVLLKSKTIDTDVISKLGFTPLHLAAFKNELKVVDILVSSGANVNVGVTNNNYTPLHFAAAGGFDLVIDSLVKVKDIDVNIADSNGFTPLHLAVQENHFKVVEILVINGANINAIDSRGETALHWAAAKGFELVVGFLLKYDNIDVNAADKEGCTPLHMAAKGNNLKEFKMLVSRGANVNAVDCYGETPLHLAARYDSQEVVQLLLKNKDIDINIADENGFTPLHIAALGDTLEVVKILVSNGANVNAAKCRGMTPLHWAAANGSDLVLRYLLNCKGVDVNIVDDKGRTPLQMRGFQSSAEILSQELAKPLTGDKNLDEPTTSANTEND